MAGNADYDGAFAFSVAKELSTRWTPTWIIAWPFYGMIKGKKKRFNNGFRDTTGTRMLVPINYLGPVTSARVALTSNQFTPITPTATQGFTQAEYYYATYENTLTLNNQEYDQLKGSSNMIPVLPGKIDQLMYDFTSVINTDSVGTQNGTGRGGTGQVMGEQYFLSTSNSPGNISQTTYSNWQASVNSSAGPFTQDLINAEYDRINALGRGAPDFVQLSYTGNNNVYNKLRNVIGSSQILSTQETDVTYGFKTFEYMGMTCFQDGPLGTSLAGSMVVGSSDALWLNLDTEVPKAPPGDARMRILGTSSYEYFYFLTLAMGVSDPARFSLLSGIA